MLNQLCLARIKSTWSQCMIVFIHCCIWVAFTLLISTLCSCEISAYSFLVYLISWVFLSFFFLLHSSLGNFWWHIFKLTYSLFHCIQCTDEPPKAFVINFVTVFFLAFLKFFFMVFIFLLTLHICSSMLSIFFIRALNINHTHFEYPNSSKFMSYLNLVSILASSLQVVFFHAF